jgi:hypothetical protein
LSHQEIYDRHLTLEIAAPLKQGSPHEWQLPRRSLTQSIDVVSRIPYVYVFITKTKKNIGMKILSALVTAKHLTRNIRGSTWPQ